ncbi:hypothetical protein ACFQ0R_11890 [Psychroflexus salinarum]|uniref:Uncharacterized protein n=1 Tax=Psychroflexus salinarum TaxID=546024 RepID=A0ABW3GU33_9FLAO
MKSFLIFALTIIISQSGSAQTIDFDKLTFQNLSPFSSKEKIIEKLGGPQAVYEPNYECGFLSAEEQNKPFYTLDYNEFKFTGNDNESYVLDKINFETRPVVLTYSGHQINSKTDINTLAKIFSMDAFLDLPSDTGVVIIPNKNKVQEDGYGFEIINGKLISIHYWSPC